MYVVTSHPLYLKARYGESDQIYKKYLKIAKTTQNLQK